MKTYFVVEKDFNGWVSGYTSKNLEKVIEKIGIVYTEDWEDDDKFGMQTPQITITSLPTDKEVLIFEIDDTKIGYQLAIGDFNFFRDCLDDVQDFILDNYRNIIMSESTDIKKFNDFI